MAQVNICNTSFLPSPNDRYKHLYWNPVKNSGICRRLLSLTPFQNGQILDSSKLKEFADDNFKFDKKKRQKVLQAGRKHCGKRRNCSLRAIAPFPTVFSKDFYSRHVQTGACLGKGKENGFLLLQYFNVALLKTDMRRWHLFENRTRTKFKHIYFTSIEKQVPTTYTNLSRF